jgi:hypothetical protein
MTDKESMSPSSHHLQPIPKTMNRLRIIRTGVESKDGKILFFSLHGITVIRPWPEMRAWRKWSDDSGWRAFRPEVDLRTGRINPYLCHRRDSLFSRRQIDLPKSFFKATVDACQEFASCVNPEIGYRGRYRREVLAALRGILEEHARETIASHLRGGPPVMQLPFLELPQLQRWHRDVQRMGANLARFRKAIPEPVAYRISRFRSRHWHLLAMTARCPGAMDLIRTNPGLAAALASNWAFGSWPSSRGMEVARRLVNRKRRVIAGRLGFPDEEWAVRLLGQLSPRFCNIATLQSLRIAMRNPRMKDILRHLSGIDKTTLILINTPKVWPSLSLKMLEEVREHGLNEFHGTCLHSQLKEIGQWYEEFEARPPQGGFRSLRAMGRLHDQLYREYERRRHRRDLEILSKEKESRSLELPSPPIEGTDEILPLSTCEELVGEGYQMHHCAGGLGPSIKRGGYYLYKILQPERATLSIKREEGGPWKICQLKGKHNGEVRKETRKKVESWLRECQKRSTMEMKS